ncbi:hypothetical protein [Pararhodonellum marinum]|uniref:hypothetical protein n=1 Tax=Pararhodonellum marinum TaxID=2755358 RepID=UPI001E2A9E91|nr:hypothetical protein [Pararhodonellum marinum]
MKTIVVKNGYRGKKPVIRLEFPYDFELKEAIKKFEGVDWDPKEKVWWIAYTDDRLTELLTFFKGRIWLVILSLNG